MIDAVKQYTDFLKSKGSKVANAGFSVRLDLLNPTLFEWQKELVRWALLKGCAALFSDCGTGKTLMQLEWGNQIYQKVGGAILIIAPLAVSAQTKREGIKLGIDVNVCRKNSDLRPGINITNYEMIDHFESDYLSGVVLDESSILKSFSGKIKESIIRKFANTPYKLACTATPAPNDFMELGNHAEFLNVSSRGEMLATYFVHDGSDTSKWRLKGHAEHEFWRWVASWAAMLKSPDDLGYDGSDYRLPRLLIHEHLIDSEPEEGSLLVEIAQTLTERRNARKDSLSDRVRLAADLVNGTDNQVIVWCNLNEESEKLTAAITGSVEVSGSHKPEYKEKSMLDFASGDIKCLVTKPRIAGFGMNWQNCSDMVFCGLSDSYEQYYQAVRRCWRFGQKRDVNVHIILSEKESAVLQNIKKKQSDSEKMTREMIKLTSEILIGDIKNSISTRDNYISQTPIKLPGWLRSAS